MTEHEERVSEPGSKSRIGRPPAFPQDYLDWLQGYYRQMGRNYAGRSLVNKAYMLRALGLLYPLLDELPMLSYLMNHGKDGLKETLMTRLGRIRDEGEMIETAVAVSVFKADKECDFEEMRNAWEVLAHVAMTKPRPGCDGRQPEAFFQTTAEQKDR